MVFQKKNNHSKEFKIPLGQYCVSLKMKNGEKKNGVISSFSDSTLILKVWAFKRSERGKKRMTLRNIY